MIFAHFSRSPDLTITLSLLAVSLRCGPSDSSSPKTILKNDAGENSNVDGNFLAHDAKSSGSLPDAVAPPSGWGNVTNGLDTQASGGGDLTIVSASPNSARILAGVASRGLWATDDSGKTWTALGTGNGSAVINNDPTAITYDPSDPSTYWESGIYGGGGFKTTDNGKTFSALGNLNHSDLLSVDFTDPARNTLLAGPHEQEQELYLSHDGGGTWTDIGANLPANTNFSTLPLILDTKTFLVGSCGWGGGACGVLGSVDGGDHWTITSADGPVARPLWASDGTIYWVLANDGGMISSSDKGKTWTKSGSGPVSIYYSSSPVELPDGRVVTLGKTKLMITSDHGSTWKPVGDPLPFPGQNCGTYGVTYSAWTKTFFINHNDCSGRILPTAVWSAGFDYTKP